MTIQDALECEDSWDDDEGEEGEEPDPRRIDNFEAKVVPNEGQNLAQASQQSSRRPSDENQLVSANERSGGGEVISIGRGDKSEGQNEGNEVGKCNAHSLTPKISISTMLIETYTCIL